LVTHDLIGINSIVLTRIDAARNMHRFYAVAVTPTLFGEWQHVREWGRIGQGGTLRTCTYPAQDEAERAQARSISRKLRRGYVPKFGCVSDVDLAKKVR
jgi:predicted DNA-binding WGR domain protein